MDQTKFRCKYCDNITYGIIWFYDDIDTLYPRCSVCNHPQDSDSITDSKNTTKLDTYTETTVKKGNYFGYDE